MPRKRALINREDLPECYRNFTPIIGYPLGSNLKSKEKLIFVCDTCGNEKRWSIDNLYAPVQAKNACSICSRVGKAIPLLDESGVCVKSYHIDKKSNYYDSNKNRFLALRYLLSCKNPDHPDYEYNGTCMSPAIMQGRVSLVACPECLKEKREKESESRLRKVASDDKTKAQALIQMILKDFRYWKIQYLGRRKLNDNSSPESMLFELYIPLSSEQHKNATLISDYIPGSTIKIRYRMLDPNIGIITDTKLLQIYKQTLDDIKTVARFDCNAQKFGAKLLQVKSKFGEQLKFRYENILGTNSQWQTEQRANENAYGRTKLRQGEIFIMVTLRSLYPEIKDFQRNVRNFFKDKNLEIDLFSRSHRLCIEYQGHQNHYIDPLTKENDQLKRKLMPADHYFVVIDRLLSYSPMVILRAVQDALAESGFSKRFQPKPVNLIELEQNFIRALPEAAHKAAKQLFDGMMKKNPNHEILTSPEKILRSGRYEYRCGRCGCISEASVKQHIDRPPSGCKHCRLVAARQAGTF